MDQFLAQQEVQLVVACLGAVREQLVGGVDQMLECVDGVPYQKVLGEL